jgi:hypothetical protein
VVGGLLGRVTAKEGAYTQLSVFNEVLSKIRSSYVEDPNLTEVMHGALRGLLESLDSYSTYLTPDEYSRYKKHKTNGNGDVGLELSKEKVLGYVYVIHAIDGGPADKAGVKAGDVIADRFVIERRGSAGGMGVVWRAVDRHTEGLAAVKVVAASDTQGVERFVREARALAELRHPGIARGLRFDPLHKA